jgi:hypothetical protein
MRTSIDNKGECQEWAIRAINCGDGLYEANMKGGNCQGTSAAYPPVTGQGHLNGCGLAKAG